MNELLFDVDRIGKNKNIEIIKLQHLLIRYSEIKEDSICVLIKN